MATRGADTDTSPDARTWTALFLGVLVVSAAAGGVMGFLAASTVPAAQDGGAGGALVTFELTAFLSGFVGAGGTIEGVTNPDLVVDVGDEVTIVLTNGEELAHNVFVDGYGTGTDLIAGVGSQDSVTFVASQEGTFAYYCTVEGHRAAGMEGRLIVGEGGTTGPSGPGEPGPAQPVDVADIAKDPTDLPGPLNRNFSTSVDLYIESREVVAEIEPGTTHTYWAYNGTVPGPFFRVRQDDTVTVHFRNAPDSSQNHSIDFHAVTGPGGGAVALQTAPGEESVITFKAIHPGLFVYHCATPHIPTHIAKGLYGLILVEPAGGLPEVDREFYVLQSEFYTKWAPGTEGHQEFDGQALTDEEPNYVVFNGRWQALTGDLALQAEVNETVRIYFGNIGVNLISSFHVIGDHFDFVYPEADLLSPPLQSVQTTLVPAGGAVVVDLTMEVPGNYILVDHSLSRTIDKGALGILTVTGPENPEVYQP